MIFRINEISKIEKAISYAKRLLETAKYGIIIDIRKRHPKRTNNQNRYYWGHIIKTLADALGYLPDEMHEILKHKFLTIEKKIIYDGEELETVIITKSTANLKTVEFEEYLEKIRVWSNLELGIMLLLPNEYLEE